MAQRRKAEGIGSEKNSWELAPFFLNSVNDVSYLYAQAVNLQKLAFDAGQKHSLERLNQWLTIKMQQGTFITTADILAYLQEELNKCMPGSQLQQGGSSGSHQSDANPNRQNQLELCPSGANTSTRSNTPDAHSSQDLKMEIREGPSY